MTESNILLTGKPGIGKTTVIKRTVELLSCSSTGFYTREIKRGDPRVGFEIISLQTGERLPLAHTDFTTAEDRVGKYGVKAENLLGFLKEINEAMTSNKPQCLVIDEIGKMEFFTPGFHETVDKAFQSSYPLLATIMKKSHKFCDYLKNRGDTDVIEVTENNRDDLPEKLAKRIEEQL
ncbi:NTPase [Natranaerobius thermophilus]|uniref:Nucleoside-triphosphatase THEP1 n=1 Tax=Natranaerobius thermophilus (strain ATCC BAA-1301 / DSM 18059 / JW/NM-WN-LF) TaxID=457570 RepID=NTPTH_NATTJ|nr:NTPase [Natranaerobius thermophilus]B2A6V4.1 RecName: Full=Nucleoside-triphosphatase THEP1; Short=NTPase THEP1; AltName: Full=Nucleoside triphosphate phosphohydrolase [Natranaerobius thermophilus JW/NM-WN-LF]ACB84235.1 protein of unknown function DUF265 [Natranaerobius thermophilus JW/NM-WN-LF]